MLSRSAGRSSASASALRAGRVPAWAALVLCGMLLLGACEQVPVDEGLKSRPIDPTPEGVFAERVVIMAPPPVDTDGDFYPDTISTVVHLFPSPEEYPLPIWRRGTFTFALAEVDGTDIARWEVPAERVWAARRRVDVGPAYFLEFSLPRIDQGPARAMSMRAVFTDDETGRSVDSRVLEVRLGLGG